MEKKDGTRHISGFSNRFNKALELNQLQNRPLSELGELFGVSKTAVHFWITRDNTPGLLAADTIAQKLNVSFEWLLTGRGSPYELMDRDPEDILVVEVFRNLSPTGRKRALQYMFNDCNEYETVPRSRSKNQAALKLVKTKSNP